MINKIWVERVRIAVSILQQMISRNKKKIHMNNNSKRQLKKSRLGRTMEREGANGQEVGEINQNRDIYW